MVNPISDSNLPQQARPLGQVGQLAGRKVTVEEPDKADALFQKEIQEAVKTRLAANLDHNLDFILANRGLRSAYVKNGRLYNKLIPGLTVSNEVKELVQQTLRQARGSVIDAGFGHKIQEKAQFNVDRLTRHLSKHFPELLPQGTRRSPLQIFLKQRKLRILPNKPKEGDSTTTKNLDKSQTQWEQLKSKIHEDEASDVKKKMDTSAVTPKTVSKLEEEVNLQRRKLDSKINKLRTHLEFKSFSGGLNPVERVNVQTKTVAIQKTEHDKTYGSQLRDELNLRLQRSEELGKVAGINESIASHLNELVGDRLPVPLATTREGVTLHAYVESKGSFYDVDDKSFFGASFGFKKKQSQRFVLTQLIMRNADCHGDNVLITKDGQPVAIDFGRSLHPDPTSCDARIRAVYLRFPGVGEKLNKEDRQFFAALDVDQTVEDMREALTVQYPREMAPGELKKLVDKELNVLRARLIMVQEGVKMGCTLRELIGLDLPPLSEETAQKVRTNVRNNNNSQMEKWEKYRQALSEVPEAKCGFQCAWSNALTGGQFNPDRFRQEIQKELEALQKTFQIYGSLEHDIYSKASLDIS